MLTLKSLKSLVRASFAALALTLVCSIGSASEAPLFQKRFVETDDAKFEALVIQTYAEGLAAKKANGLQAVVKALKEELEDVGQVNMPETHSLFQISSGKAGAGKHAFTYLLGIPVMMDGTGMIEEYGRFIRVHLYLDMETESITVTLNNVVDLVDKASRKSSKSSR